jgi:hypothetical protein
LPILLAATRNKNLCHSPRTVRAALWVVATALQLRTVTATSRTFLCLFRIPAANVLAMRVVRAFAQGFVFAGALNLTRMYAVCAVPVGGGGDGLGGLAVLLQAAPAELRRPPLEVCPTGQRKHLQLLAFAPLTIRKGQLGAVVGRFWGPVQPGTWLPHPGAHSARSRVQEEAWQG